MLETKNIKDIVTLILIVGLFVLAIFIIKPIFTAIIYGILLAYIIYPIHRWLVKKIKSKNLSAFIILIVLLILIVVIFILVTGSLLKQSINFYLYLQQIDFVQILKTSLPKFISSSEVSTTLASSLSSSFYKLVGALVTGLGNFILDIPAILLRLLVVFLTFFFVLRDGKQTIEYLKSLSPLKKEIQEKFSRQLRDITNSVLIGQIVVGIIQGLVAGLGFFIFGVPNAALLTLVSVVLGIIPIIGPWLVWVPVDIYLFAAGRTGPAIGLLIYGLFLVSWIDNAIRPLIVSRKTKINSGIILIGMIGGLFVFGILGLIIGPLVLSYILLILELYRKNKEGEDFIFKKIEKK